VYGRIGPQNYRFLDGGRRIGQFRVCLFAIIRHAHISSFCHLSKLPAASRVLELSQAVALFFPQQSGQILREAVRDWFATAQAAGDLQFGNRDIVAKRLFPAHVFRPDQSGRAA
jgi:hypothetical protein